jgi:CBS domain-containing protein
MRVRSIMTKPAIVVDASAPLEEVAALMLEKRISCVPVVDEAGRLRGIITVADFAARKRRFPFSPVTVGQVFDAWLGPNVEGAYAAARSLTAGQVMTPRAYAVAPDTTVPELLERMFRLRVGRFPVVERAVPVGVVTRSDLLKLLVGSVDRPVPSS